MKCELSFWAAICNVKRVIFLSITSRPKWLQSNALNYQVSIQASNQNCSQNCSNSSEPAIHKTAHLGSTTREVNQWHNCKNESEGKNDLTEY